MSRAALAILSTENLLHNLEVIKQHAPGCTVIAMIKANGYGHGLRSTALRLQHYVASFGVASIDEALALRRVGVTSAITLMEGVFEPEELVIAAQENFHVVFHEYTQLQWLAHNVLPRPLTAWLKVDTGMGRLGFSLKQAEDAYERLCRHANIVQPVGIMSHFACADDREHPLNRQQINAFNLFTANKLGPKSFCNSAAVFSFKDAHYTTIRPGLALYGISPCAHLSATQLNLKPVATLQTRLMAIRTVQKGSSLGYGARYICPETMRVGVIAMGYGDGYPRTARDGTPVLINGVRCPLVGRVSMDMITVDLRPCPTATINDAVILWGDGLPLEEVAPYTNQCPYDMLTAMQARVKFQWSPIIEKTAQNQRISTYEKQL